MHNLVLSPIDPEILIESISQKVTANILKAVSQKNQPDPEKEMLTVEETAEFLNLAKPTIYGLIHRKELPNMKRGKKVYFSKKDLIDYLQAGKRKSMEQLHEDRKSLGFNNQKKGLSYE